MAGRKVLNKYYPPDFGPAKIQRRRMPKKQQIKIRMMLPMSIRCSTCGYYIYKGTKFNSRKEDVIGESHRFRFLSVVNKFHVGTRPNGKAQNILAFMAFFLLLYGVTPNLGRPNCRAEPLYWKARMGLVVGEEEKKKRDAEEMGDAMKSLENRTLDSKREMDILSALDEMNQGMHAHVSVDSMLETLQRSAPVQQEEKLQEEDEALIRSIFQGSREFVR
ncbi:hypothetical protein M8C21_003831 [Ambrosia artemisiifolia]|uniref:Uncharacterized protein n=1 Tax=Ambrosia artemisiifolia TaxID=4212 RepID=A0AAD5G463_AMBAR|nr:hypothetical protein M8C21_003831 [Ambrosia artemisiifolia]